MSERDVQLAYEDLWYIKLVDETKKLPLDTWGGYSQDFEAAENVYNHVEVLESEHENWGIVGIKGDRSLLIFDVDVHKAPDGFDIDEITIPSETPVIRSQSGGLHIYFIVARSGEGGESDFEMTYDLGFDIDIRGSYVKHHVVAPADIPGVGGRYEVRGDEGLLTVQNPADAAERVRYLADDDSDKEYGEPLLRHGPDRTGGAGRRQGAVDINRDTEPPDEMPTCYHRGLQIRGANPDDPNINTHKINVLTGLCGIAAGYSVETIVEHFCSEFAPGLNADEGKTRYQLEHMADRKYAPPAISTLREYGILDEAEDCDCDIEYHGGDSDRGRTTPRFDVIETAAEADATADGGTDTTMSSDSESSDEDAADEPTLREDVEGILLEYDTTDEMTQKTVVHRAALAITEHRDFVYPRQAIRDWRSVLHRYDPETGIYRPDGEEELATLCERLFGDFLTNSQMSELEGKVKRLSHARQGELETPPNRRVVGNGVLDLHTGDLDPFTPDEYHRTRIDVDWPDDPENAACPRIDAFLHEVVEPKDVPTLYQLAAHTLYGEYIEEKAAMLVGDGRNGKSVFLDLLEHFVGGDNVAHQSLQSLSRNQFAANNLHNKFANFHPDMSDENISDLGTFKKLTGRDTMDANVKYEKPITFENFATLIFAANTMPQMAEDTTALWRRWIYINFPHEFNDEKPEAKDETPKRVLIRQLTAESELQGLLVRCVDELSAWWDGRALFDNVLPPEQVRDTMKRASEPVYAFAAACLEADEDEALPKRQARDAYRAFAREEELPTIDDSRFGEKMLNIRDFPIESGQKRINGQRTRCYTGVRFSSRGRQIAGLDDPDDEQDGLDDAGAGVDGGSRGRMDVVRDAMRELGADSEPVSRAMIEGRASARINPAQAKYGFDDLKDRGGITQPPDGDADEWMLNE
jgi:P4 family phage/plasmid primase-like protien